jgi:archaellum biogenesis protein FlaJ (TadC family)
MDLWLKIGTAILLVMMLMFLLPRAKEMLKNSPKGTSQEWMSALIPLLAVAGFVLLLVMML